MRNRTSGSRWWDPPGSRGLPFRSTFCISLKSIRFIISVAKGTYTIVDNVCKVQGYAPYSSVTIPMMHFPLVNISLVWVAAPIAALLCRRNPVVGLSYYGFILANGILHAVTGIAAGGGVLSGPGVVSGTLIFIPATVWVAYVCLKSGVMTGKALTVSLAGGISGHIALLGAYLLLKVAGAGAMLVADVVASFLPILVAGVGSKLVKSATTPIRNVAA